ncbi:MAG: DeoR family transcriptional regulator [Desulfitobacteriaceae bacterium]
MLQVKRLEEIAKNMERNGAVDVNDLSERFGVTNKTIRKDSEKLEEMGWGRGLSHLLTNSA